MPHDIFISYSKEDKPTADAACEILEKNGFKCWVAPRNILPGVPWGAAIIDAIRASRVMVFVFSSHSNSSQHVMRELGCAVDGGTHIIPFRVEDVKPSKSIEYFITVSHWLDALPEPSQQHFDVLAETVKHLLTGKGEGDYSPSLSEVLQEVNESKGDVLKEVESAYEKTSEEELNEYEQQLQFIEDLIKRKQWGSCVRECGELFEKAMKQLLKDLLGLLVDPSARQRIMDMDKKIGKGQENFDDYDFKQLITLYAEAEVFHELRKLLTSNLQKKKQIDWGKAMEWYNTSLSESGMSSFTADEAQHMFYWVKLFVYDCELAGEASKVAPVPEEERALQECPCCHFSLEAPWNYCPDCGAALKVICQACHRTLAPDFKICPYCESRVIHQGVADMDRAQRAKEEYRVLCVGAYLDGVINIRERKLLNKKRLELGLSSAEAENMERQCAPENVFEFTRLVEGVYVDGVIDETEKAFLKKKAEKMKVDSWVATQIIEEVIALEKGASGDKPK
jgi:hypothetical protein